MKKEEEKFLSTCLNGKDGKKLKLYWKQCHTN